MWQKPNPSSNSMGHLILHLCGNITQYILSGLGGKEDVRERDKEFTSAGIPVNELLKRLEDTVAEAIKIIQMSTDKELQKVRVVQGYTYSGLAIVFHVVEHYSYHLGQIAYFTKLVLNKDLGFYAGRNLNLRNE